MKPTPRRPEVLLLSSVPAECAAHLDELRGRGMTVRVASAPERGLALLRRRPNLVLVDLVHGPGLDARLVNALNRPPRVAPVVALHEGRIDTYLSQVEHLTIDGFRRLNGSEVPAKPHRKYRV